MNKQTQPIHPQIQIVTLPVSELRQMLADVVNVALLEQSKRNPPPAPALMLEPDGLPKLATRDQTADYLGVSVSTVDQYAKDGLLTKKKVGLRAVRFDRGEVQKLARTI